MKVGVITESRAEYGVIEDLLHKIDEDPYLELRLFVLGQHLEHNTTDFINFDYTPIPKCIHHYMEGYFSNIGMLIVTGDRIPMLQAATYAAKIDIPILHISGGDKSGNVDDKIRNCISLLADAHFVATEDAKNNLHTLGIQDSIFVVGNPGVKDSYIDKKDLNKANRALIIYHPDSIDDDETYIRMRHLVHAAHSFNFDVTIFYPNNDPGRDGIIKAIKSFKDPNIIFGIRRDGFIDLMCESRIILGNSSCALIEAPSCKLPAVNAGNRQKGRYHGSSVIDVDEACMFKVSDGIKKALKITEFDNPYANKGAEDKIIEVLHSGCLL